jgi:hypothetical protein
MNRAFFVATGILVVLASKFVSAAPTAETPSPTTTAPADHVLPELNFDHVPLEEAVAFLHDLEPRFNPVIVREPGVAEAYPDLSNIKLKNITVGQFLEFVQTAYAGIEVKEINGPKGPIHLIRVSRTNQSEVFGIAPGPVVAATPPPGVQVIRLADVVQAMIDERYPDGLGPADPAEVKKKALSDVLSLLQAALEQIKDPKPAMMKLHDSTQTLLFEGSGKQQEALTAALAALQPVVPARAPAREKEMAQLRADLKRQQAQQQDMAATLRKELDVAQERLAAMQDQLMNSRIETETLRAQLERARRASTRPSE